MKLESRLPCQPRPCSVEFKMIRALPLLLALTLLLGCADDTQPTQEVVFPEDVTQQGKSFVQNRAYRRAVLKKSLVDPTNGYSRLRLEHYALEGGWDDLPVWNPLARPIVFADVGSFRDERALTQGPYSAIDLSDWSWAHEDLMRVGARAFEEYPLDVDRFIGKGVRSAAAVQAYGLWVDARGRVGGALRVRVEDTGPVEEAFAQTCATCHANIGEDAGLIHGVSNASFDQGALMGASWGPGLVDVTPDGQDNPAAIIDLRPIRYQKRLHWAATLYNDLPALAVRIETLLITSLNQRARPPREIAWALAYYLWNLSQPPASPVELSAQQKRGQTHFRARCVGCHAEDGTTSEPVLLEVIGTDDAVGRSSQRGTGTYRVPSLWKVSTRTQWMHHGQVRTLEDMFTPERLERVPGHPFGTDLDAQAREDLLAFLTTLDGQ